MAGSECRQAPNGSVWVRISVLLHGIDKDLLPKELQLRPLSSPPPNPSGHAGNTEGLGIGIDCWEGRLNRKLGPQQPCKVATSVCAKTVESHKRH